MVVRITRISHQAISVMRQNNRYEFNAAAMSLTALLMVTPIYAQCLGVYPAVVQGLGLPGTPVATLPDAYSQSMLREAGLLEQAFDLQDVRLSWVMEMNALSHPEHGVMMGEPMGRQFIWLSQQKQNPEIYNVGFCFVLAHEYAHQFQFKHLNVRLAQYGISPKEIELQADLLGAYWMGVRCRQHADTMGLNGPDRQTALSAYEDAIAESSFLVGEGWLAPGTHGTKAQRVSVSSHAFQAGWRGRFGDDMSRFKPNRDGYEWMGTEIRRALGAD